MDHFTKLHDSYSEMLDLVKKTMNWSNNKISISSIDGGTTNILCKYTNLESNESVLVRIYGKSTDTFMNRSNEELYIKSLSDNGIGPKIYKTICIGTCSEAVGRIEEWYSDIKPITNLDKENLTVMTNLCNILNKLHKFTFIKQSLEKPALLDKIDILYPLVKASYHEPNIMQFIDNKLKYFYELIQKHKSDIVMCHNDLTNGNILLTKTNDVKLIDFEYTEYNFRGYELGNYFCEYAGLECDWSIYPNKETQMVFLQEYARHSGINADQLFVEANIYALGSHLLWLLWAIVQDSNSTIKFDYLQYATNRIYGYCDQIKFLQKNKII
jgi:ethanolamine kinase